MGLLGRIMRQRRTVAVALDYIRALSRETRANCWDLALKAGHEGPHRMQALLSRHKWSWEELRDLLPGLAQDVLRDDPGDLIGPGLAFDETADLRKGKSTACVSPQHAGVTGKVENCVTWVFAALVTALGQAWVDFDVYMPECWARDLRRRKKAGIPGKLAFATKPELAIAQVKRLMAAGIRAMWAAADEVYGRSGEFRAALRELGLAYVVIIPCDYRVTVARNTVIRADQAIPDAVFERRSCGNGTKGPRYGDWALIATADPRELLLIRRFPDRDKNQYAFYLCWSPEGRPATMTYFITIAGRRWPVEVTFKTAKDALGWDQCQARTRDAICRHTALTALAQLRTAAIQAALARAIPAAPAVGQDAPDTPDPAIVNPADLQIYTGGAPLPARGGLPCPPGIPPIELSAAETSRIERLARDWKAGLITASRLAFQLRWSTWRRRHQARARWHHYAARLAAPCHLSSSDRKEVTACNRHALTASHA
jgi:SRSO17 transposase